MLHDNEPNCLEAIERRKASRRAELNVEEECICVPNLNTSPEQFDKIVRHRQDTCLRVLLEKNEEYSRNGDRLHNFRSAGRMKNLHPLTALEGMEVKHLVSIQDMVDDVVESFGLDTTPIPSVKMIEEKFTDAINYLLLKEALIREAL